VLFRARSEDTAVLVEDDGARSTGADVNAEDWNTASFLSHTCARRFFRHAFVERRITFGSQLNKVTLLHLVNVHGGHLRPLEWACQRGAHEGVGMDARLTSGGVEHTMPSPKFISSRWNWHGQEVKP
jgi:hypothetical protein